MIFGRRLACLFTTNGSGFDTLMIGKGLGEAWTRDGQHRGVLVGFEDLAREKEGSVEMSAC